MVAYEQKHRNAYNQTKICNNFETIYETRIRLFSFWINRVGQILLQNITGNNDFHLSSILIKDLNNNLGEKIP